VIQKTQDGDKERYYYINGKIVGRVGNINGDDFDYSHAPVSDELTGTSPYDHVATGKETLSDIAFMIYGDRSLWYVIADANGYS
ncbi:hypothetical protein GN156_34375, partial [bacterium LRH843]|nr:hypothetical protein [bacterium LRH843]